MKELLLKIYEESVAFKYAPLPLKEATKNFLVESIIDKARNTEYYNDVVGLRNTALDDIVRRGTIPAYICMLW